MNLKYSIVRTKRIPDFVRCEKKERDKLSDVRRSKGTGQQSVYLFTPTLLDLHRN